MRTRLLVSALTPAGLAWATPLVKRWSALMNPVPPVEVGQPAPPLTLMDPATGEPVELQDYEGRAVLLTLWATWCGPCRSELVAIEAVHREFAAQGLTVDPIGRVFGSLVSKYNVSHDSGRGGPGASLEN